MPSFGLELSYLGSDFCGWQRQPTGRTVQGEVEDALSRVLRSSRIPLVGASRTDTGVHAEHQFAAFRWDDAGLLKKKRSILHSLNALVGRDVSVWALHLLPSDFRLRTHIRGKIYRYQIWTASARNPFLDRLCHSVTVPLDLNAMEQGLELLKGSHDFRSFAAAACPAKNTVRTIQEATLDRSDNGRLLQIRFHGDGFLHHMVRVMVGTLIQIGLGRRSVDEIPSIFERRDRRAAGPTAPARGLLLERLFIDGL